MIGIKHRTRFKRALVGWSFGHSKCPCSDVVADLASSGEQVQWAALTVADGVHLGVHAALGPTD